jgi:hypothetical protein
MLKRRIRSKATGKNKFFKLAGKLSACSDPAKRKRIKVALARMTFGKQ